MDQGAWTKTSVLFPSLFHQTHTTNKRKGSNSAEHTRSSKKRKPLGGISAGGLDATELLDLLARHLALADGDVGVLGQVLARAAVVVDAVPLFPGAAGQHAVRVQPAPAEEGRWGGEALRWVGAEEAEGP